MRFTPHSYLGWVSTKNPIMSVSSSQSTYQENGSMWQILHFVKIGCALCVRGESINSAGPSFGNAYPKKRAAVVSVSVAEGQHREYHISRMCSSIPCIVQIHRKQDPSWHGLLPFCLECCCVCHSGIVDDRTFADFVKAYDTANHDLLLCILEKYGAPPKFIASIHTMYTDLVVVLIIKTRNSGNSAKHRSSPRRQHGPRSLFVPHVSGCRNIRSQMAQDWHCCPQSCALTQRWTRVRMHTWPHSPHVQQLHQTYRIWDIPTAICWGRCLSLPELQCTCRKNQPYLLPLCSIWTRNPHWTGGREFQDWMCILPPPSFSMMTICVLPWDSPKATPVTHGCHTLPPSAIRLI